MTTQGVIAATELGRAARDEYRAQYGNPPRKDRCDKWSARAAGRDWESVAGPGDTDRDELLFLTHWLNGFYGD